MDEKEHLHFKTNVQLKSIIGKDLINDDNIAILELVKNSFDADAKTVSVTYSNLKVDGKDVSPYSPDSTRLVIRDDGIGMDLIDVRDKWLNIAYSQKKSNKKQHKRMMAGAKGVGRFSCDRLGEYLILYSRKSGDEHYVKLKIDWKKFEIEDESKEIQSIGLEHDLVTESELIKQNIVPFDHGVVLEIIHLRSSWVYPIKDKKGAIERWDVGKLVNLKKYLEKLINPNQAFEVNDFGIYLEAPEFVSENSSLDIHDQFIGRVENRIFEKLDFKSTSIEVSTKDSGKNLITELKDKGETIFRIDEVNSFYPFIKDVSISLYYLNSYAKAYFTRQTGIQSVNYGSVFLFINGFRIPPYGDVGNDWLALDQRKAQGTSRYIGLREIVGRIEILDDENDFQIISSREGIVRNENYKKLTNSDNNDSLFFKTLRRLERYVVEGLAWDSMIYESKDPKFKEIERKILSGEAVEHELEYREDDRIKRNRVYNSIHGIISARAENVNMLYINESLILNKISEERRRSELEFEKLIEDFENKKIDSDTLSRILEQKAQENSDLDKQIKEFSKYSNSEETTKALLELERYRKTIGNQSSLISDLQNQLFELQKEKESAEREASQLKDEAAQADLNLQVEREKNYYLLATRRTLSPDADGLIHTIKINNIEVRDGLENIIDDLSESAKDSSELIRKLGHLKICAERSLKMAEFVTRSDLKDDIEEKEVDIVRYVEEYIKLYGETFSDRLNFQFENSGISLTKKLSVLNLSIALDNLISNAVKWGAQTVLIRFDLQNSTRLFITISDDGKGLSKKFLKDPEQIFLLSVRDNPPSRMGGSGIGLFYTKELLNEMNSDIEFLGNNVILKGATFKLIMNTI